MYDCSLGKLRFKQIYISLRSEETSVHNERRDMYRKERVGSPNCNIGLDDSYVEWSFDPFTGDLTQSYPRQIDSQDIVNFKAIAEEMPFIDMSTTPKEVRGSSHGFYHYLVMLF